MASRPPFFRQERYDTCALACLRMVLAHHGIETSEAELIQAVAMEEGGVHIEELLAAAKLSTQGKSDTRALNPPEPHSRPARLRLPTR